jgi:hypothetical protein
MTTKRFLILFIIPLILVLVSCKGNQENKLIGVWKQTRFDALPKDLPYYEWEFTSDNDLIKYEITEEEKKFSTTGRWGFTKYNRLNISKFDVGFNGEWEIVTLRNGVLRMVLKVYDEDTGQGAGQILVEFVQKR